MPADKHLRERDLLSYLWDIMSKKFSLIFPFSRFTQINSIFPLWLGTLAITGFFDGYLQHFSGKSKFNLNWRGYFGQSFLESPKCPR